MIFTQRGLSALAAGALGTAAVLGAASGAGAARAKTTAVTLPTSAQVSFSATLAGTETAPITMTGTGQLDFAAGQAAADLTLPAGLGLGQSGPTMAQVVASGDTLYALSPGITTLLGGTPWVSVSGPAAGGAKVPAAYNKLASAMADPAALVTKAQAAGAATKSLGTRTEGGQSQTGTEVDVDVAKVLAGVSGLSAAERQAAQDTAVTLDVWSDPTGRLAELTVAVHSTGSGSASLDLTVTSYDTPVSISVPSPSETHALSSSAIAQLLPEIETALGVSPTTTSVLSALGTHLSTPTHPAVKHHRRR